MGTNSESLLSLPRLNYRDALFVLFLALITVAFHPAIAFRASIPFDEDSLLFFYPLRALHQNSEVGFWDPYLFCGFPREANPQSQIGYPPNLLFEFLPVAVGYGWLLVGHLFWGGLGVYIFLRGFRLSSASSFFGALAFLLSTYWRCKITNLGLLEGASWVPWLVYFYLYALENRKWLLGFLSAIPFSFTVWVGVPHTVIYAGILLLLLTLAYAIQRPKHWLFYLLLLSAVSLATVLMTTGIWYPALLYAPESYRGTLDLSNALAGSIGITDIWKVFLGGLSQPDISRCDPWEGTLYLGVTALFMLPLGWVNMPRRLRFILLLPIAVAILFTLGEQGGLFVWLYRWVPGWSTINMPNRSLLMAAVTLPVFTAFGLEWWLRERQPGKTIPLTLGFVALLALGIFIWGWNRNPWVAQSMVYSAMTDIFHPDTIFSTQWAAFNLCLWLSVTAMVLLPWSLQKIRAELLVAALCLLLIGQSAQYSQRLFLQTTPPDYFSTPKTVETLKTALAESPGRVCGYAPFIDTGSDVRLRFNRPVMMHRLPEVDRVQEIQGYDPLMPRRYVELIRAWAGQSTATDELRTLRLKELPSALLSFLGVQYVVGYPTQESVFTGSFELAQPDRIVSPMKTPKVVDRVRFRWMAAGAMSAPQALEAGRAAVMSGTQTVQEFPIRFGMEIANYILESENRNALHRPAPEYRWFPIPTLGGYTSVRQYIATYPLNPPAEIDRIAIDWRLAGATLSIREIDVQSPLGSEFTLVSDVGELPVYRISGKASPVYLARQAIRYRLVDEIVEKLKRREPDDEIPVFLEENQSLAFDSPPVEFGRAEPVKMEYTRPHSDKMRVRFRSPYDGIMVIQENYSPFWGAILDGEKVEILRANHAFMAVPVSAGEHELIVEYKPKAFYMGWSVGGAAWMAVLIWVGMALRSHWLAEQMQESQAL